MYGRWRHMWRGALFVTASWKALTNSIPASSLLPQGVLFVRMQVAPELDAGFAHKRLSGRTWKLYPGWPVKQRQDIRCPNHSRRAKSCCSGTQTYNVCFAARGRRHQHACCAARGRRHTMSAVNPLATSRPRDLATSSAFRHWRIGGHSGNCDTFRQCIPA